MCRKRDKFAEAAAFPQAALKTKFQSGFREILFI
jgi:hypothetical protein